jgi:glucokinase
MAAADRNPRPVAAAVAAGAAVGIDVGGTKVAAGLVDTATGSVLERRLVQTRPERGAAAVLADCAALATELGEGRLPVGIALCELVDLAGRPASGDTLDWRGLDVEAEIGGPRVVLESDVRAAALAEARFGAGAGASPFLFVAVGTGSSACLVVDGRPYAGARGEALVLGAPPVELLASGPALARAAGLENAEDVLGDPALATLVDDAAAALGAVLAVLANALDPSLVVLGGGLGAEPTFRVRVERALQERLAYPRTPPLPLVGSTLGADGGVVGAALVAADGPR